MKPLTADRLCETTSVKNANALLQKGWCVLKIFLQRKEGMDMICYVLGENVKYCDMVPKKENEEGQEEQSAETTENKRL